jgi:hypothetical protein
MNWLSIWPRAAGRPINRLSLVTVKVRLRKDEARAFAQFLEFWDWQPRPEQAPEYAAMGRAGRRLQGRLHSLGFKPPPHPEGLWHGLWETVEELRPQAASPPKAVQPPPPAR